MEAAGAAASRVTRSLDDMLVARTLEEVWASPSAARPPQPRGAAGAGAEAGRRRGRGSRGGQGQQPGRSGRRRGGRRGARGARGRGGRRAAGRRKGLEKERDAEGCSDAVARKLPITNAKRRKRQKQGNVLQVATWNCFGLSLERIDYLFGSEGQPETGVFPLKGGDWLVGLTECRGGEQRLEEFFSNRRLVVSDPPPGVIQALLWLRSNAAGRSAVIAVDSLYAANQAEGWWNAKKNKELIAVAQRLLEQVRQSGDVTFVHVRGHTGEVGNERADRLVQLGKTSGPYSRLAEVGFGEGDGRTGRVEGHLRSVKRPGEEMEYTLVLNEGEVDELITLGDPDVEQVSDGGELEETQLTDESGSVLRWIFRDSHVSSPSSSDEPGPAAEEPAETDGEQGQDHSLAIELDAVVNWLENLDLGENCELSSGLEAE
eukprot:SAG31_NODE_706_length_12688_cov_41.991342_8_plen_431_part_00